MFTDKGDNIIQSKTRAGHESKVKSQNLGGPEVREVKGRSKNMKVRCETQRSRCVSSAVTVWTGMCVIWAWQKIHEMLWLKNISDDPGLFKNCVLKTNSDMNLKAGMCCVLWDQLMTAGLNESPLSVYCWRHLFWFSIQCQAGWDEYCSIILTSKS